MSRRPLAFAFSLAFAFAVPSCSRKQVPLVPPPPPPVVAPSLGFLPTLPYDPLSAEGLAKIREGLRFDPDVDARLHRDGFAYFPEQTETFFTGYAKIYEKHLPLFISGDSILNALHLSYDKMLATLEEETLRHDLATVLATSRARLAAGCAAAFDESSRADADLYLAVAESLLNGKPSPPVAGASTEDVEAWLEVAAKHTVVERELWGSDVVFDGTQLLERGHYTSPPTLTSYFRAYMWLTRAEPIVVATGEDGRRHLDRRGLEGALVLASTFDATSRAALDHVGEVRRAFIGIDRPFDLDALVAVKKLLALDDGAAVAAVGDETTISAISSTTATPTMFTRPTHDKHPALTFSLFGQVATVDGQVMSAVLVYDRFSAPMRPLPNALDVAYGALHNDQAWPLLERELKKYDYASKLAAERKRIDAASPAIFSTSLYGGWMDALRTLSPTKDLADPRAIGLPSVAGTEAWGRRILATQLASIAELRHDTILYASPSYQTILCDFPSVYVDPYPDLYDRIGDYARRGRALLPPLAQTVATRTRIEKYFDELEKAMTTLASIARAQRKGEPLSPEHLAFVNDAVVVKTVGCGTLQPKAGWFWRLYYEPMDAVSARPTIADVATDPNTGRILHLATGYPRFFVMTAETCDGPRAFAGVVSDYRESITKGIRLDDSNWGAMSMKPTTAVPWLSDLVP